MAQRRPLHHVSARGGTKYPPEYFTALKKQVPDLVCLGDNKPFVTDLPYWWCLLEWFAPWNKHLRPLLWIDLDTYVFDLSPFDELDPTLLWMLTDFNHPQKSEAGIMLVPKAVDHIWQALLKLTIRPKAPAGQFIAQFNHRNLQNHVNGIYSYKRHAQAECPTDATVVCFHGFPKPHESKGWSRAYWNSLIE